MIFQKGDADEIKFAVLAVVFILVISVGIFFSFLYPDAASGVVEGIYTFILEMDWRSLGLIIGLTVIILIAVFLIYVLKSSEIIPERDV